MHLIMRSHRKASFPYPSPKLKYNIYMTASPLSIPTMPGALTIHTKSQPWVMISCFPGSYSTEARERDLFQILSQPLHSTNGKIRSGQNEKWPENSACTHGSLTQNPSSASWGQAVTPSTCWPCGLQWVTSFPRQLVSSLLCKKPTLHIFVTITSNESTYVKIPGSISEILNTCQIKKGQNIIKSEGKKQLRDLFNPFLLLRSIIPNPSKLVRNF